MDLGKLYTLTQEIEANEKKREKAKKNLTKLFAELVPNCPHSEAVGHYFKGTGQKYQVCKICGIEDSCYYGSDPGDEYNYGHAGSADPRFWPKDGNVETAKDEKYFWTFRKQHGWEVKDGVAYHW